MSKKAITYMGVLVGEAAAGREYDPYIDNPYKYDGPRNFTLLKSELIQCDGYELTRAKAIRVVRELTVENERESGAAIDDTGKVVYLAVGERYMFPQKKYMSEYLQKTWCPKNRLTYLHSHPGELAHLPHSTPDLLTFVIGIEQPREIIVVTPHGAYTVFGGRFTIPRETPNNFLEVEYTAIREKYGGFAMIDGRRTKVAGWKPPHPDIYLDAMRRHGISVEYELQAGD